MLGGVEERSGVLEPGIPNGGVGVGQLLAIAVPVRLDGDETSLMESLERVLDGAEAQAGGLDNLSVAARHGLAGGGPGNEDEPHELLVGRQR